MIFITIEENKNLSKRLFDEVWNKANLDIIEEFIALDYVIHMGSKDLIGIENYKFFIQMYLKAFPDIHYTVDDLIAEGDKVVCRVTTSGTHRGDLEGIPPTGKRMSVNNITIFEDVCF